MSSTEYEDSEAGLSSVLDKLNSLE